MYLLVCIIINSTFVRNSKNPENMFTFAQYLGFLAFLTILTIGFWLMIFLIHFVFYWIGGALFERYKEKKAQKALEQA